MEQTYIDTPVRVSPFVVGVGAATTMLEAVIAEIAPTSIPLLLYGEVGTGKEIYARRIHERSSCHDGPFVRVSCASDATRFLSDLEKAGNTASNGTILFDEIAELDAECQRKLMCVLPDGDSVHEDRQISARVISTTSRSLEEEVRAGHFRSELYYRINGICLRLAPLRERKEDIELLAECFLAKHAVKLGRARRELSERALRALINYSWPGNVRELENVAKKIIALNDESMVIAELERPAAAGQPSSVVQSNYSLKAAARAASQEAEREMILKALERTRWNRKRAAQELQVSYKSLLYKLKQIGAQDSQAD